MLEEAVAAARTEGSDQAAPEEWSPQITVGMPVLIPEAYVADLGVRRISVGSGLALATWGIFLRAAKDIKANGTFNLLANGAASAELNGLFRKKS